MVDIRPDPANPERVVLTQTVTVFLDKVLLTTLSDELEKIIAEKAQEDFRKPGVLRELRRLSTDHLAKMLGVGETK